MDTRERVALLKIAAISAAWALGEALVWQMRAEGLGIVVPAILAAAAYVGVRDLWASDAESGTYWRGRRIDRDRWRH